MEPTDVIQNDRGVTSMLKINLFEPTSSLLDTNTAEDDDDPLRPPVVTNNNGNHTIWQCGRDNSSPYIDTTGNSSATTPFAFLKRLHSNILDCCVPKNRNHTTKRTTSATFHDDTLEETFYETIPYEVDTIEKGQTTIVTDGATSSPISTRLNCPGECPIRPGSFWYVVRLAACVCLHL